ncbi:hypothetical protein DEO72_LG5g1745 [Vigna unguiculata]|uniref:Uncharacterized protein n=1 Tax=Vigna unguiculata TaxID=3917 RepID=A0A4D6LXB5_VIGUN|nr:hypothetical protein DEO72_LG5g1745 [Vigna unguiculata]
MLKARPTTHTCKSQELGFPHAPPGGKVLPARRHILDFPVLAGFGWFYVVGGPPDDSYVFWIFPRNRLAMLKARPTTHTCKSQELGFPHAPPGGKVLPARRHILDFPVLAGFGWFYVVGGLG